jgi:hypothetical protein
MSRAVGDRTRAVDVGKAIVEPSSGYDGVGWGRKSFGRPD